MRLQTLLVWGTIAYVVVYIALALGLTYLVINGLIMLGERADYYIDCRATGEKNWVCLRDAINGEK